MDFYKERSNVVIRFHRIMFRLLFFLFFISYAFAESDVIWLSDDVYLKKSSFKDLKGWEKENYKEAIDIFLKDCKRIEELPENYNIFPQYKKQHITKEDFFAVCKIASIVKDYNNKYLRIFFENYFMPYKVIDTNNKSLFTGYYLPQINAKRTKDSVYKYPIYRRPHDLKPNIKYYTRKEINNGVLNNKNLEILYTDDLVELFFFHVQGSGNVFLVDENRIVSLGYDGKNNYDFTSIGKYMLNNNLIDKNKINAKDIKNELKKDLRLAEIILNQNDSYIFFKIIENGNITGAFGSELIPFRTIAVDKKYIPLGFPIWLSTTHNTKNNTKAFNKLVISNDTGSAIKGAVRGDIFFGSGLDGENNASYQSSTGEYFLLLPQRVIKKIY